MFTRSSGSPFSQYCFSIQALSPSQIPPSSSVPLSLSVCPASHGIHISKVKKSQLLPLKPNPPSHSFYPFVRTHLPRVYSILPSPIFSIVSQFSPSQITPSSSDPLSSSVRP